MLTLLRLRLFLFDRFRLRPSHGTDTRCNPYLNKTSYCHHAIPSAYRYLTILNGGANRTQLICQMRAFCLEYGIAIRQGTGTFKLDIARIIGDQANDLSPAMRGLLDQLWEEFKTVDVRLAAVSRQVEILAARHETARRLMTIPGIGPLGATALIAAVGDARQFRKARDLAAWLGLVPRQNSTGGKTTPIAIPGPNVIDSSAQPCGGSKNR